MTQDSVDNWFQEALVKLYFERAIKVHEVDTELELPISIPITRRIRSAKAVKPKAKTVYQAPRSSQVRKSRYGS